MDPEETTNVNPADVTGGTDMPVNDMPATDAPVADDATTVAEETPAEGGEAPTAM